MTQKVRAKLRPRRVMPKIEVEVKRAEVKCAFCEGTGKDPFGIMSHLSNCCVCGGKGKVRVIEPYVPCRACDQTGVQPFTRLTCLACYGTGVITVGEPTETCPACFGTGTKRINGIYLHCLRCKGAGVISKKEA